AMGVDPVHLGVIFIVNLEIGYLTPPVGLNLFLSACLFKKTFGQVLRYTAPFVLLMLLCLVAVTWVPKVSLTLVDWIYGGRGSENEKKIKSMKELLDENLGE